MSLVSFSDECGHICLYGNYAAQWKQPMVSAISKHPLKKSPMGHITHLRNLFKSINAFWQSFQFIITLIRRRKINIISFLRITWSLFVKTWPPPPSPKDARFVPILVEIGPVVLEKKIFFSYFRQYILAII